MSLRINRGYFPPIQESEKRTEISKPQSTASFQNLLNREIQKSEEPIKISGHAGKRLLERKITLNDHDMKALGMAMEKAKAKGAKDSLMLYKDIAFIANIPNRTLITAIDPEDNNENVFTNIDSAVIVK